MNDFIDKVIVFLTLRNKERRDYDAKVNRNDAFILELLDELASVKPRIEVVKNDYHFYLKGYKVMVSSFCYIYISGLDLEYSSKDIRSSFGIAVRTIYESQKS